MTMILLFVFVAASMTMYTQFFQRMGVVEMERAASSITDFMLIKSSEYAATPEEMISIMDNRTGVKMVMKNLETGTVLSIGSIENASSASVSSVPLSLFNATENTYRLWRIDVYAGS